MTVNFWTLVISTSKKFSCRLDANILIDLSALPARRWQRPGFGLR